MGVGGVQHGGPAALEPGRQGEVQRLEVRIEDDIKVIIRIVRSCTAKKHSERLCVTGSPVRGTHGESIVSIPAGSAAIESSAKHRMLAPKRNYPGNKREEVVIRMLPIHPGRFAVVAICIVVAPLCPSDLVSGKQHGHTLRKKDRCQQIPLLARPKLIDSVVQRRSFGAAIP